MCDTFQVSMRGSREQRSAGAPEPCRTAGSGRSQSRSEPGQEPEPEPEPEQEPESEPETESE